MKSWNARRIKIISVVILYLITGIVEVIVLSLAAHYKISTPLFLILCIISSIVLSISISYSYIPQHSILQRELNWNKHLDPCILSLIPAVSSIITIIPLFNAMIKIFPNKYVRYMTNNYIRIPNGKIPFGIILFGGSIFGLSFFIGYLEKYYIHDKVIKEQNSLINRRILIISKKILGLLYLLQFDNNRNSKFQLQIQKDIKQLLNLQNEYHYYR